MLRTQQTAAVSKEMLVHKLPGNITLSTSRTALQLTPPVPWMLSLNLRIITCRAALKVIKSHMFFVSIYQSVNG